MKIPRPTLDRHSVVSWATTLFLLVIVHQSKYEGWLGGFSLAVTLGVLAVGPYFQGVLTERWRKGGTASAASESAFVAGYFVAHAEVSQVLSEMASRENATGNDVLSALSRTIEVRVDHDPRFRMVEKVSHYEDPQ